MRRLRLTLITLLACVTLTACLQYEAKRGVEVKWQTAVTGELEKGKSTRSDVMELLGPPSQVISLDEETALYYLFERTAGEGYILILYNRFNIDARYDRAVFFFDENDILQDYSTYVHESENG